MKFQIAIRQKVFELDNLKGMAEGLERLEPEDYNF